MPSPLLRSRNASQTPAIAPHIVKINDDDETNKVKGKSTNKSFVQRTKIRKYGCCCILLLLCYLFHIIIIVYSSPSDDAAAAATLSDNDIPLYAPMGKIIYGAKSKGVDTANLVKQAIQAGFRHIATGGFHNEYNEQGVGVGWTESGVQRNELYLQTLFLANTVNGYDTHNCNLPDICPPPSNLSIEDQVHLSIKSSLYNLQTDYLDAVLVHNFRAKLQPYNETLQAWKVLETYVRKGIIRHLGIVSVHDKDYFIKLYDEVRIAPTIIQNRFHSNRGYDTKLRPTFREWGVANQLFWILTGSAGGRIRNNDKVKELAKKLGGGADSITPNTLLYSFTMEIGGAPLIGTKSLQHMKDDVKALIGEERIKWTNDDFIVMAKVIDKNGLWCNASGNCLVRGL